MEIYKFTEKEVVEKKIEREWERMSEAIKHLENFKKSFLHPRHSDNKKRFGN